MTSFSPPVEIAAWLACMAFAVWLFNQLARAWFILRGKPTPQEQAARASGIEQRNDEHSRRIAALESAQGELRKMIIDENGKLYNRINAVAEDTSTMRGELKTLGGNVQTIVTALINGKDAP